MGRNVKRKDCIWSLAIYLIRWKILNHMWPWFGPCGAEGAAELCLMGSFVIPIRKHECGSGRVLIMVPCFPRLFRCTGLTAGTLTLAKTPAWCHWSRDVLLCRYTETCIFYCGISGLVVISWALLIEFMGSYWSDVDALFVWNIFLRGLSDHAWSCKVNTSLIQNLDNYELIKSTWKESEILPFYVIFLIVSIIIHVPLKQMYKILIIYLYYIFTQLCFYLMFCIYRRFYGAECS